MEQIEGCYGCRSLARRVTDAQATIAALQARVRELEQWVQDQSTANLETMRHVDEMQSRAMEAESQLTQRTAELEAANTLLYKKNCALGRAETSINDLQAELERVRERVGQRGLEVVMIGKVGHYVSTAVKEELERVRGERDHAKKMEAVQKEVADNQTWHVQKLRTLIAALPKVEGEIRVEEGKVISVEPVRGADPPLWWRRTIATFEDGLLAKHYSKLLQHRQGMEG